MAETIRNITAHIPAARYIAGYMDRERCMAACLVCGNYGRLWKCPPFDDDFRETLGRYSSVYLRATVITPEEKGLPLSSVWDMFLKTKPALEKEMLEMEADTGGLALGYAGDCTFCGVMPCRRTFGMPCLHPELVRPSLEACGFDVCRTASEILGTEIKWGKDGMAPEYITAVSGLFYGRTGPNGSKTI